MKRTASPAVPSTNLPVPQPEWLRWALRLARKAVYVQPGKGRTERKPQP